MQVNDRPRLQYGAGQTICNILSLGRFPITLPRAATLGRRSTFHCHGRSTPHHLLTSSTLECCEIAVEPLPRVHAAPSDKQRDQATCHVCSCCSVYDFSPHQRLHVRYSDPTTFRSPIPGFSPISPRLRRSGKNRSQTPSQNAWLPQHTTSDSSPRQ